MGEKIGGRKKRKKKKEKKTERKMFSCFSVTINSTDKNQFS